MRAVALAAGRLEGQRPAEDHAHQQSAKDEPESMAQRCGVSASGHAASSMPQPLAAVKALTASGATNRRGG